MTYRDKNKYKSQQIDKHFKNTKGPAWRSRERYDELYGWEGKPDAKKLLKRELQNGDYMDSYDEYENDDYFLDDFYDDFNDDGDDWDFWDDSFSNNYNSGSDSIPCLEDVCYSEYGNDDDTKEKEKEKENEKSQDTTCDINNIFSFLSISLVPTKKWKPRVGWRDCYKRKNPTKIDTQFKGYNTVDAAKNRKLLRRALHKEAKKLEKLKKGENKWEQLPPEIEQFIWVPPKPKTGVFRMVKDHCNKMSIENVVNMKYVKRPHGKARVKTVSNISSQLVFHGTSSEGVEGIQRVGFRVGGNGVAIRNGSAFGNGVYCSQDFGVAYNYGCLKNGGVFVCIVPKVTHSSVCKYDWCWVIKDPSNIIPIGFIPSVFW